MNNEDKYPFLSDWCAEYYKRSGIEVHPGSVPTDVVLDELMGKAISASRHIRMIADTLELITERFNTLSQKLKGLTELESFVGELSESLDARISRLETESEIISEIYKREIQ